jgi:hypothetical protein
MDKGMSGGMMMMASSSCNALDEHSPSSSHLFSKKGL